MVQQREDPAATLAQVSERPWHSLPVEVVLRELATTPHGLTAQEAQARLARYGLNEVAEVPPTPWWKLLLHEFVSPLVILLAVGALVLAFLREWIDFAVIVFVLLLNASLGFYHERRAEQAIRALSRYLAPKARVVRDGHEALIPSRELVPGDIVLLESGVRVPADLRLIECIALMIDESILTGESIPVLKSPGEVAPDTPPADRRNMAFSGTVVTSGRGRGVVVATGMHTELGKIALLAREEVQPETPLQRMMNRFARTVALVVLLALAVVGALGVGFGVDPILIFKFAVGAAVAIIPEGLPIVFTLVLAVAVQRMARRNAIVRQLPAIETLGSTTVIGSDKTGTLTENRMTAQVLWAAGEERELAGSGMVEEAPPLEWTAMDPWQLALLAAVVANEAHLTRDENEEWSGVGDPTDVALLVAAANAGIVQELVHERWPTVAVVPFEPERRFAGGVIAVDGRFYFFVKGAPERVLDMCTTWYGPDGPRPLDRAQIEAAASRLATRGLRTLGMAYGELDAVSASFDHHQELEELLEPRGLTFLGLVGLWDPPRPGVKEAIAECQRAGIRVVMITGDHADTAQAIGALLGIAPAGSRVVTGRELRETSDEELKELVRNVNVFARVEPEHKLRIVRALQAHGEIVAVTGDGVNDAPALRAADVGVAMGKSGTDVAREAADIVLADDNFVTIAAAVEEGRGAFDNLRKATFFLISTGAAMLMLLPAALVLGFPVIFYPAQLIWLNVVTNGLQDVALAFEPKEPGIMQRRPRPRTEGVLSRLLWERLLVSGIVMAAGTLWIFDHVLESTGSVELARTIALTTMVVFQMFQVGNARSSTQSLFRMSPFSNRFLFIATLAAFIVHVAALYVPVTQLVLRVEPIPLEWWPRIVATAFSVIVVVELHKWLRRRWPYPSWETSHTLPRSVAAAAQ